MIGWSEWRTSRQERGAFETGREIAAIGGFGYRVGSDAGGHPFLGSAKILDLLVDV
jgi:hypothetical protein